MGSRKLVTSSAARVGLTLSSNNRNMSFTIYYHTKCEGFYGRAFAAYAMLKHAGKEFEVKACDLAPADAAGDAKAQQLMADGVDINTEMGAAKPVERIAKWMEHFETLLGDNDYFVNNTLSYADFSLFPAFNLMEAKKALGKYEGYEMGPKMTAWLERMKAVPALAEMAASGVPYLPAKYM